MKTKLILLAALCSIAMGSVRIGLAFMLLGTALPALSDEEKTEEQSLDQAANDPTASLMSVTQATTINSIMKTAIPSCCVRRYLLKSVD